MVEATVFLQPCLAQQPPRREGLGSLLDKPSTTQAPHPTPPPRMTPPPAAQTPETGKKLPRPDDAALREAVDLVQQAYGDDLRKDAAKAVDVLLKAAAETSDTARRYALLSVAEQGAIDAGDANLAMQVVGQRTSLYDEDKMRARHSAFLKVKKAVKKPDVALFSFATAIATEAADAEEYDLADGAADSALEIAFAIDRDEKRALAEYKRIRQPDNPPPEATAKGLIADAKHLQKSIQESRRETSEFKAAEQRLLANPSDAEAARRVGEHLCFVKRQWNRGLKYLARAGSEQLRVLASQELAITDDAPADPGTRFRLAGGWWRLADAGGLPSLHSAAIRAHAAEIYAAVMPQLVDPTERALARKRSGSD
jgi:hypothetical protein